MCKQQNRMGGSTKRDIDLAFRKLPWVQEVWSSNLHAAPTIHSPSPCMIAAGVPKKAVVY